MSFVLSGVAHTAQTAASFLALPPGVASGLYGDLVAHSDWQINLQPPGAGILFASELIFGSLAHSCLLRAVEKTLDVEEALDTILQVVLAGRHVVGILFCLACPVIAICRWRRINRIRRLQPSMQRNKE